MQAIRNTFRVIDFNMEKKEILRKAGELFMKGLNGYMRPYDNVFEDTECKYLTPLTEEAEEALEKPCPYELEQKEE